MKVCLVTGRMDAGGVPVLLSKLLQKQERELSYCLAAPTRDTPYGGAALKLLGPERCLEISHRAFRWKDVVRLFHFVKKHQVDLVSCEGKSGGIVGRLASALAGTPSVYFYHGVHYLDYERFKRSAYFSVERLLGRFTAAVVAVSAEERQLIKKLQLCSDDKLRLCENGVDGPEQTAGMPIHSNPMQFVHITRFNSQKNSDLLLDICERLRSRGILDRFRFLVIGDGDSGDREAFEGKIAQRRFGETIACRGYVSNVQPVLAASHGLLSTSRWEGQPLGVLECMAAGRCVVATDVVGHQSIIDSGENGLLFTEGDSDGAANLLGQLLESPGLLNSLAKAGRLGWERKYSLAQCVRRRGDLYKSVLSSVSGNYGADS